MMRREPRSARLMTAARRTVFSSYNAIEVTLLNMKGNIWGLYVGTSEPSNLSVPSMVQARCNDPLNSDQV